MLNTDDIHVDIVVPNKKRYLSLIGNIAEEVARALANYGGDRDALAFHLNLVLTEAMVNAIEHSTPIDTEQTVRVCIFIEEEDLCVRVYDHGQGFDIDGIPMPDPDDLSERGRGIFLIRSLMDAVKYRKTEAGNVLEMHKRLF
jgi:serine/threonine-protein kinase RsbW